MASLQKSERVIFPAGATDVLLSTRRSYHISLTWLWSTRARVTDSNQTVKRGMRTSAVLRSLVYESVALTTRPRALVMYIMIVTIMGLADLIKLETDSQLHLQLSSNLELSRRVQVQFNIDVMDE